MKNTIKNEVITHENPNEIPAGYYKNNTDLKTIIIPETVSEIGPEAFSGCTNLKNITLPKNLKVIRKGTFENCSSLENIIIPNGIIEIEEDAFLGCKNLENIVIPESVISIGESAFEGCLDKKLNKLIIPSNVKFIGNNAFSNCLGLDEVVIEEGVSKIGDRCFENCTDLKKVSLPNTVFRISEAMFKSCRSLKEVKFPETLRFIEDYAFQDCTGLKNIEIPESVFEIKKGAFSSCIGLKTVKLPESLRQINDYTFDFCLALKYIKIPDNVTEIGDFAFSNCFFLYDVALPESLKSIGNSAFKNSSLEEIEIPENVKTIESHAFRNCRNLKNVILPSSLEEITSHSFSDCTSLDSVTIPEGVKKIQTMAFADCTSISEINLPNSIEEVEEDSFLDCSSLQVVNVPDTIKKYNPVNKNIPYYFNKTENGFSLSMEEQENSTLTTSISFQLPFISRAWKNKDVLLKEQRYASISKFYNEFLSTLPEKDINYFIENHNFSFFKQLDFSKLENTNNIFKLLYNLGGMSKPITENGKTIDYAQKVIGLIQEKIKKGETSLEELSNLEVEEMNIDGFNKEFTDFFLENFSEIIQEERENNGFITRCYNEFDTVQKTNTRNRGNQSRLKPTVKRFAQYFDNNKFTGITPETKKIADAISPYFMEQELFEDAVSILSEKQSKNTPNNILDEHLKEEDVFSQIERYTNDTLQSEQNTLSILTELAKKEFTYDWLEKNDPENFILGKLCSCCSHLDGSGYGIMRASIVDPNVQTMVIRDKNGDIIAKSTLFINPDEQ